MDALQRNAYFSARLTSNGEIPALNKMFLHSERQLLVLRIETNHPNRQRLAQYGNHQHSPTKLLLVSGQGPKPASPDKSLFDLVKEIVAAHLPAKKHGI